MKPETGPRCDEAANGGRPEGDGEGRSGDMGGFGTRDDWEAAQETTSIAAM